MIDSVSRLLKWLAILVISLLFALLVWWAWDFFNSVLSLPGAVIDGTASAYGDTVDWVSGQWRSVFGGE